MRGLKGKGVLVSGGSRGIGKAAVIRFLEENARVFFCGVKAEEVTQTLQELNQPGTLPGSVDGMACDIAQVAEIESLVTRAEAFLGRIDILINNAGIAWQEPFLEITPEHWDQIMQVNLRGMFLVGQAVARRMVADKKGGAIVNMSSTNGLVGEENYAHYNATKGGVLLLTKTMALELGRHGIRVNALCPGFIQTPLSTSIYGSEAIAAYAREKIAMQRTGTPEEVAAAYAFLASDDASFINGEGLVIDGGQLAV